MMANDVLSDEQIADYIEIAIRGLARGAIKEAPLAPQLRIDVLVGFRDMRRELQQHRLAAVQAQPVSARPDLVKLVTRWREHGAYCDTFHATMGTGWKRCADELEAAIRDETREPDTAGRVEPMHTGDDPIVDDWSSIRSSIETAIESAEALPQVGGEEASILENLSDTLTVIDRLDPIILAALQRARESAQEKAR
jgi:hypothetical protein